MKKAVLFGSALLLAFSLVFIGCEGVGNEPSIDVTLIGIEVTVPPAASTILIGENLDLSGMAVKRVYSNGASAEIFDFTVSDVSGFDSSRPGEKEITVSYRDMTASFIVTVTGVIEGVFDTYTPNITITVDTSIRHQFVRGFGVLSNTELRAGTGRPSPDVTVADIHKMFNPDWGLGLNILRIPMYDDLDGTMTNTQEPPPAHYPSFIHPTQGFAHGRNYDYFEHIRIVNAYGGYVVIVPWTAPARYKGPTADSAPGEGTLVGTQFALVSEFGNIANWMRNYLLRLIEEGAPVFAVSAQNNHNVQVGSEGMRYSDADMNIFVRDYLYPAIRDIPGFGGSQWTPRVLLGPGEPFGGALNISNVVMNDPATRSRVDFFGRQFFLNMHQRLDNVLDAGIEVWMTEHNDIVGAGLIGRPFEWDSVDNWNLVWHLANEIYCSLVLNDESAFIWGYSKRAWGLIGDGTWGSTYGAILPRGYVMSHFSRFAANTRRVQVTGEGTFLENLGTAAGTAAGNNILLPVQTGPTGAYTNFNPATFASGNSNQGGQNQATTKAMAFESTDGSSISVIIFTPTNNTGFRGQDMGYIRINLPEGFTASCAYAMRSNAEQKAVLENIALNNERNAAIIRIPRSNIVSLRFTRYTESL